MVGGIVADAVFNYDIGDVDGDGENDSMVDITKKGIDFYVTRLEVCLVKRERSMKQLERTEWRRGYPIKKILILCAWVLMILAGCAGILARPENINQCGFDVPAPDQI